MRSAEFFSIREVMKGSRKRKRSERDEGQSVPVGGTIQRRILADSLPSDRASATEETTSRNLASGSLRGLDEYNPSTSVNKNR